MGPGYIPYEDRDSPMMYAFGLDECKRRAQIDVGPRDRTVHVTQAHFRAFTRPARSRPIFGRRIHGDRLPPIAGGARRVKKVRQLVFCALQELESALIDVRTWENLQHVQLQPIIGVTPRPLALFLIDLDRTASAGSVDMRVWACGRSSSRGPDQAISLLGRGWNWRGVDFGARWADISDLSETAPARHSRHSSTCNILPASPARLRASKLPFSKSAGKPSRGTQERGAVTRRQAGPSAEAWPIGPVRGPAHRDVAACQSWANILPGAAKRRSCWSFRSYP